MKVPRSKGRYGQLDESCSFDDASSKASSVKSFGGGDKASTDASAATHIAIGQDGQVVIQPKTGYHNITTKITGSSSSQGRQDTIREEKRATASSSKKSTKQINRKKKEINIGWQRNPTRSVETKPGMSSPRNVDGKGERQKSTSSSSKPKRSQAGEERRKRRNEIITGWQRNPRTVEAKLAGLVSTQNKPNIAREADSVEATQHSTTSAEDEKISKEEGSTRLQKNGRTASGIRSSREKRPSDRKKDEIKRGEESNPEATTNPSAPTTDTTPPLTSRTPSHMRVYRGTRENRERQRSRSRGAKRRTKKSKEEAVVQWKREPVRSTKELYIDAKIAVSEKVDKSTLGEVAKRLEIQKKYEEDKRDAIGKLRGRKYRGGGPMSKAEVSSRRVVGSRSPGPRRRERAAGNEQQFTWYREPVRSTTTSSRARRIPSKNRSEGDVLGGVGSADLKSSRRLSRTYSSESQSRRRSSARSLPLEKETDTAIGLS
jgi:hypothetical protein